MNPTYKKTSAVTDVGLLPIKVYHRSKDVQCYRISLLITIIILVVSVLVNLTFLIKSDDKPKKSSEDIQAKIVEIQADGKEVSQ